jgi:hypothetical protein
VDEDQDERSMTAVARTFPDYRAALLMSLEEEISGEAFFARLSSFHGGRASRALLMLAEVEAATASAIRPLAERHGLAVGDDATLRASGQAEADGRREMSWRELVEEMATTYPVFVQEFDAIMRLAPEEDRATLEILVAHEVAAVRFAEMESRSDPASMAPLEEFLAAVRA